MEISEYTRPDYLFEVSWEVCNKIGGIYTVLSSRSHLLKEEFGNQYIVIGPDVWKETREHPDFSEDRSLFPAWREKAESEGLKVRIGRWNVSGKPLAILVDFTPFFPLKDKIFAEFWETYRLDSLTGDWDYIEPALFGYAAGKVVESFGQYQLTSYESLAAHFHEWMTATGILYLKKHYPRAARIFTTHATVLGRSIAGNGMALYRDMESLRPDAMAANLGLRSKYSLELLAATHTDVFTTVSQLTSRECLHFLKKEADIITPNGFDAALASDEASLNHQRKQARENLIRIASHLCQTDLPEDAILVLSSGRYEYRNKGLDVFIDALAEVNRNTAASRPLVAFIAVPGNQAGPNTRLLKKMNGEQESLSGTERLLSHYLHSAENDTVIRKLLESDLDNRLENNVKVVFVPAYLNGRDGVFDLEYYELLTGFDLSVFPSYYEPWGYTPLESLVFGVPAVTTSLTGFGVWVNEKFPQSGDGLTIISRNDENYEDAVKSLAFALQKHRGLSPDQQEEARRIAREISNIARWPKLLSAYFKAWDMALHLVKERDVDFSAVPAYALDSHPDPLPHSEPVWKKVLVNLKLPERFAQLESLAKNLWWTWNPKAEALFERIDPIRWTSMHHSPLELLESLSVRDFKKLERDKDFILHYEEVLQEFNAYMAEEKTENNPLVAYFSMEYGLHDSIKIYSGGLGMLAGDYLKEASDSNANMLGVGLLYRYGYFKQLISLTGDQISETVPQKFTHLPVIPVRDEQGHWVTISLALPGRNLYAKVWQCNIGRVPLYLLDTDIEENNDQDRSVTHQLYGGDWENRFKQELLLGVGGIRLLSGLGIRPDIYHCNEGHAAFLGVERLRKGVQEKNLSFPQALEVVRASTLFTTHTPVPAGHDYFSEDILRTYIPHYADRLNISWEEFLDLGRFNPGNHSERFSMSVLAARLSQEMNGVSAIHGKVSRDMFKPLFPGFFAEELHIGHVTNGVHYPTWTGAEWQQLHREIFGEAFLKDQSNASHWERIREVPDEKIWDFRSSYRKELISFIRKRLSEDMTRRQESPGLIVRTMEGLREDILTIGFARRFATYKRAHLLFSNLNRLEKLVNDPDRPVQFIFAGKAHPADKAGQDIIKRIIDISRQPAFVGKIVFVENYDIALGKQLIRGVDVWLNTPTRPLEASGTSGEKAVMNGVVNFSVLDGWWAEGFRSDAGWAIKEERTYDNQEFQDQLDAETIYNTFEESIVPLFYSRKDADQPLEWISFVKNTIAGIAPHFTMKRMLDDYYRKYYLPQFDRAQQMREGEYRLAKEMAAWKEHIRTHWAEVEVVSLALPDSTEKPLELGQRFRAEMRLRHSTIQAEHLGVEVIFGRKSRWGEVNEIIHRQELRLKKEKEGVLLFECSFPLTQVGVFDYAFRIYPKNPALPHRMDFPLLKWI
jgi:phosphorylase/glycogen(starch) synthase